MNESEADRLRRVYAGYRNDADVQRRWSLDNPGNRAILAERHRLLHHLLDAHGRLPLAGERILDVGCGAGGVLAGLQAWGAAAENLVGVDLLADRVAAARAAHPALAFHHADATALPFADAQFDLVLCFTLFTSILDAAVAEAVAREVRRVLRPGGAVVWYDFRFDNPRNPHVRGRGRRNLAALFPGYTLDLRAVTLLPPLARRLGKTIFISYPLLSILPILRSHYLGLLVKPC